jgi:Zn-finger nucleic acid-binding protein
MVRKRPEAIVNAVWEEEKVREDARGVLHSYEEQRKEQLPLFPPDGASTDGAAAAEEEERVWLLAGQGERPWEGPFTVPELLCRPRFSAIMRVKNTQEGIEARAREFPQIREALHNLARKKPLSPSRANLCPRCRVPLAGDFYEGVAIRVCGRCQGRLVDAASVDRIVARREVAFSEALVEKARRFREKFVLNPLKKQKIASALGADIPCPACGYRMVARPYSYQYFVPVDKCLSCSKIWFDSDELEVLQILIETRKSK